MKVSPEAEWSHRRSYSSASFFSFCQATFTISIDFTSNFKVELFAQQLKEEIVLQFFHSLPLSPWESHSLGK